MNFETSDENLCSICHELLDVNIPCEPSCTSTTQTIRHTYFQCNHDNFHYNCLIRWKDTQKNRRQNVTCPLCRAPEKIQNIELYPPTAGSGFIWCVNCEGTEFIQGWDAGILVCDACGTLREDGLQMLPPLRESTPTNSTYLFCGRWLSSQWCTSWDPV